MMNAIALVVLVVLGFVAVFCGHGKTWAEEAGDAKKKREGGGV